MARRKNRGSKNLSGAAKQLAVQAATGVASNPASVPTPQPIQDEAKSYRWQERAAFWSIPASIAAVAISLCGQISSSAQERQSNEAILSGAVGAMDKVPSVEPTLLKFVIEHRTELEELALQRDVPLKVASRLGKQLKASVVGQVEAVGLCNAALLELNRADTASKNDAAFAAVKGPLAQSLRSFAERRLVPCLVITEANATRLGLFVARYYFGPREQQSPFEVLYFGRDHAGLAHLALRLGVPLPLHFDGPTPSGDLKLARFEFMPCVSGAIIPLNSEGRLSPEWTASGTFVRGSLNYKFRPMHEVNCTGECVCAQFSSVDRKDLLQIGFRNGHQGFARITTRFAQMPSPIEVGEVRPNADGLFYFDLKWDFQRMENDEAVQLTVNGQSAKGSPEPEVEPL